MQLQTLTFAMGLALPLLLGACDLGTPAVDYGDPTEGGNATEPIAIDLVSPTPFSAIDTPQVLAQVTASHASGVTAVELAANGGAWETADKTGETTFEAPLGLRLGANDVRIRATAGDGHARILDVNLEVTGNKPVLTLDTPVNGGYAGVQVHFEGNASASGGATLDNVEVRVAEGSWTAATVQADGRFTATAPGNGAATVTVTVRATDSNAQTATLTKTLLDDSALPSLTVDHPAIDLVTQDLILTVSGTANDAIALGVVEVQVDSAGWIVAQTDDAGKFTTTVNLASAVNVVKVRALDVAGNTTTIERRVYRARVVTLTPFDTTDPNLLTLTLNKAGLQSLITEEEANDLDMLYLDMSGLLLEALKAMKDYQLYNVDTSAWGQAEWNMHNILTMSPDSADVSGTSLEEILTLSQNLGIPVPVVLGDLADISPTDPFLSTEQLAQGVFKNILAPHPGLVTDPADGKKKIPISLGDAFQDLITLGEKLGPKGNHPGILYSATPTPVLQPNFAMTVTAKSNLRQYDALDLSGGKTYLFARKAGEDVIEFDFLNPDWFSVQGLADEPEVDLSFLITEDNGFQPAGNSLIGNPEGGFERGNSPVWSLPTWTFEYLVADMMFQVYHDKFEASGYAKTFSYDVGSLEDAAVISWDRGWLSISTLGGVGEPPPPQYFWGSVLELAQVRLHDGGLAEGTADLRLSIQGVRVPLSADDLVAATRPVLEGQKAKMAEIMVGDQSSYTSPAELFLATGADGKSYLYFVGTSDVPGLVGVHAKPGLFSDAGLTQKVSSTADLGSGDTVHEKVAVEPAGGAIYYAADLDGSVWRLTMQPSSGTDVRIMVEPGGSW